MTPSALARKEGKLYFKKIRHPANFSFANSFSNQFLHNGASEFAANIEALGEDVFHVEIRDNERWPLDARTLRMNHDAFTSTSPEAGSFDLKFEATGRLVLRDVKQEVVLSGLDGACFGVCGSAWLAQFDITEDMRFYGQGSKATGLEKSGQRTKFWNLDVWNDHGLREVIDGTPDPTYTAIPYVLIRSGANWVGVLVDHPGAVFMDTGSNWIFSARDAAEVVRTFWFGGDQGLAAFYVIAGSSAKSVTERLQRLVGRTPLPPLWALGHHQSRWGYRGPEDLLALDAALTANEFPCDALWLDIDYMDRYKVFTLSAEHFGDETVSISALATLDRRIVPILDPGVKAERGYRVAESGLDAGIFCLTSERQPYVGFVWPGQSWFPDFSLQEARDWWAGYVHAFRELGFHGFWLDMNDPSTGSAELDDMRFQRGEWEHWAYHNQYCVGMAEASYEGLLAARPDERPFLLSRSAAPGSSRFTAVWTGDNWSNWHHLRTSIHTSINLALSGQPFNGADVGGFGGDADATLVVAWYKAAMLFPFFRNHCSTGSSRQEPWSFDPDSLATITHFVRLRYKLLPYLYQCWIEQHNHGTAVLRPLFHDFESEPALTLDRVDDQFMVGPVLLQAPLVVEGTWKRIVILPGAGRWLDARNGGFVNGGQSLAIICTQDATPLYLREGHIVPMQTGERRNQTNDLTDIELHVILGSGCTSEAELIYRADDGESFGYARGERSSCRIRARRLGNRLRISIDQIERGWKPLTFCVVGYDGIENALIEFDDQKTHTQLFKHYPWRFSGDTALNATIGEPFVV